MGGGVVIEFDAHVGLGVVRGDDAIAYPFHCTQLADGSRTIGIGTTVDFEIKAGPLGRWEAAEITVRSHDR